MTPSYSPSSWIRRAGLAAALVISLAGASQAQAAAPDPQAVDEAQERAEQQGKARVVVTLRTKVTPVGKLSKDERMDQRAEIASDQAETADVLDEGRVVRRFRTLPLMTVMATPVDVSLCVRA